MNFEKLTLTTAYNYDILFWRQRVQKIFAGMAELADALDSGSSEGSLIQVQVLLPAPKKRHCPRGHSRFLFDRTFSLREPLIIVRKCVIIVYNHA